MEKLLSRLLRIREKIGLLKLQNQNLSGELKKAEQTIARLKRLTEIQNNTIAQQEQQLKIKRMATQLEAGEKLSPNESRELKYKINEMIKEVDKVIANIHQ